MLTNAMLVSREQPEKYALHPLAIEDLLHLGQRPKVEDYPASPEHPGRMFIVAQLVSWVGGVLRTEQLSFFLGRRTLKTSKSSGMPHWQDELFVALSKRAANATDFFSIPSDRVVELGAQVTV